MVSKVHAAPDAAVAAGGLGESKAHTAPEPAADGSAAGAIAAAGNTAAGSATEAGAAAAEHKAELEQDEGQYESQEHPAPLFVLPEAKRVGLGAAIWSSLRMTLTLCAWSTLSMPVIGGLWLLRYCVYETGVMEVSWGPMYNYPVSTHSAELVVPVYVFGYRFSNCVFGIVYVVQFIAFFFPLVVLNYLGVSRRSLLLTVFPCVLALACVYVGYVVLGFNMAYTMFPALPCLFMSGMTKLVLPGDALLSRQIMLAVIVFSFGMLYFQFFSAIPGDSVSWQFLRFCVLYPLWREVCRYLCLRSAWYLSFSESPAGQGVPVHRHQAAGFFLWVQFALSMVSRTQFSAIKGGSSAFLILTVQSVQEIIMRVTMEQRDTLLKSFFRRANERMETCVFDLRGANMRNAAKTVPLELGHRNRVRRGSSVMTSSAFSSSTNTGRASSHLADIHTARKSYYSFVVACECLSEYAAIFGTAFLLILGSETPLCSTFPYYAMNADPQYGFYIPRSDMYGRMFWWVAGQVMFELLTDVVCIMWEETHGLDVTRAWRTRFKGFFWVFVQAIVSSAATGLVLTTSVDKFDNCYGRDICYCANLNGLTAGGVLQTFCDMRFPNSSGYPEMLASPPSAP